MFLLTLMLGNWHLLLSAEKDLAFCYHLKKKRSTIQGSEFQEHEESMKRTQEERMASDNAAPEVPLAGHDFQSSAAGMLMDWVAG